MIKLIYEIKCDICAKSAPLDVRYTELFTRPPEPNLPMTWAYILSNDLRNGIVCDEHRVTIVDKAKATDDETYEEKKSE